MVTTSIKMAQFVWYSSGSRYKVTENILGEWGSGVIEIRDKWYKSFGDKYDLILLNRQIIH